MDETGVSEGYLSGSVWGVQVLLWENMCLNHKDISKISWCPDASNMNDKAFWQIL